MKEARKPSLLGERGLAAKIWARIFRTLLPAQWPDVKITPQELCSTKIASDLSPPNSFSPSSILP